MATCEITEYSRLAGDKDGHLVQAGHEPSEAVQNVTYTTATAATALQADTHFVRIKSSAVAYLSFGGTATANSTSVEAETPEYFGVKGGVIINIYDGTS